MINEFLTSAGLRETAFFFKFYAEFKRSRYLYTYSETHQVAYALKRICMRIWKDPFTPKMEQDMDNVIISYRETLLDNFLSIFEEIDGKIQAE